GWRNSMRRPLVLVVVILVVLVAAVFVLAKLNIINLPGLSTPPDTGTTDQGGPPPTVGPTNTPITLTTVVIALQPLKSGQKIPPEGALAEVQWPIQTAPQNAIQTAAQAVGKIMRTDVEVEEPILSTFLAADLSDLAAVGSDAAAVMPAGMSAVSLPVDR